jgi:Transposase, Mutator family
MAEGPRMTSAQLADKLLASEHADVLRQSVAWIVAELMEAEVAAQIGAELGQRTPERVAQRNGYRARSWDTRVGALELRIPRLRTGSYFPSFLEPRRRAEQALVAVVQEAYVNGVSTRRVDRLVEQLGIAGMSKDQVSRLCRGLDEQVRVFQERPLEGRYPYLWLDAKIERVREPGGVRHKALVIAYGVHQSGRREVIGLDVGEAETEAFWREFLRGLRGPRARRRSAVRLGRPRWPAAGDRQGAGLSLAALLGALPPGHARPRRQGPAAHDRRRHPRDLPGGQPRRGPPAAGRGGRPAPAGRAQGGQAAGGCRSRAAGLLPAAARALVQAALHQSAGAG